MVKKGINGDLLIISGNANKGLAELICQHLDVPLGKATFKRFSDGEVHVEYHENVRKRHVFIIQPTYAPTDNLMELLVAIDTARRASADEITAVIPYYGYGRQDRKDGPRVPITAKLVGNLIEVAGADRVLTMDLHSTQEQGFFDIPVDHLFAGPLIVDWFVKYFSGKGIDIAEEVVAVAPDAGAKVVKKLARRLGCPFAMIDKERKDDKHVEIVGLLGSVKDRHAVMFDDIISTAGTAGEDAEFLLGKGKFLDLMREGKAKAVYMGATHPVFAGSALERIRESGIVEVVVSNTIPYRHKAPKPENIHFIDVSELLATAISEIFTGGSVSQHCFGISI